MVRSISEDTNDTDVESEQSAMILHEFYGVKALNQVINACTFLDTFLKFLVEFIEKPTKISIKATDQQSTHTAVLCAYITMQAKKNHFKLPKRRILFYSKTLFQNPVFQHLYLLCCKAIFSLPPAKLSEKLKLKCCNSPNHFPFCIHKWKSLESYCIQEIPGQLKFSAILTYSQSDLLSNVFIN